ncbi:MAG: aminotransferase class IV [Burkholderiales bacterium]
MTAALPHTPCYLNGQWLPLNEARVSVMDRGFLFGDGVYEFIPVYGQRLFLWHEHLVRLERSLEAVRINDPLGPDDWLGLARELVSRVHAATGAQDQCLYLQISRGVALRDHAMPAGLTPTVFMMSQPWPARPVDEARHGVACVTARDVRWQRCDIKTTSLMGNVMARQISADRQASETILLREQAGHGNLVTEGATSNVWAVLEDALIGVPPSHHTLAGVRIELLQTLAEEEGIACHLRPIAEAELTHADEILLSSAAREIQSVTHLDGEPVGHGAGRGRPGPVYGRLRAAYERAKLTLSI